MRTVGEKIAIRPVTVEEKTARGIFLDSSSIEKPTKGVIVSVGSKVLEAKVGQTVHYAKYGTSEITYEGEKYIIIFEKDIIIIEDGE